MLWPMCVVSRGSRDENKRYALNISPNHLTLFCLGRESNGPRLAGYSVNNEPVFSQPTYVRQPPQEVREMNDYPQKYY